MDEHEMRGTNQYAPYEMTVYIETLTMLGNQQAEETLDKSPRRMRPQRLRLGSEELQVRWKRRTMNQDAVDLHVLADDC